MEVELIPKMTVEYLEEVLKDIVGFVRLSEGKTEYHIEVRFKNCWNTADYNLALLIPKSHIVNDHCIQWRVANRIRIAYTEWVQKVTLGGIF